MAVPQVALTEEEKYERLSDLYLTLWKQLDLICAGGRWLDIGPVDEATLKSNAEAIMKEILPCLPESEPLADVIFKDFRKTQELVHSKKPEQISKGADEIEGTNLDAFKDYLRDHALRYSQAAEEL
jgi:hypothetical protein